MYVRFDSGDVEWADLARVLDAGVLAAHLEVRSRRRLRSVEK
jgi:hypothetical protein